MSKYCTRSVNELQLRIPCQHDNGLGTVVELIVWFVKPWEVVRVDVGMKSDAHLLVQSYRTEPSSVHTMFASYSAVK